MIKPHLSEPWLIMPEAFVDLLHLYRAELPTDLSFPSAPAAYSVDSGLATVPLRGPMSRVLTPHDRARLAYLGEEGTASGELAKSLLELRERPDVHSVLLDIDSPGGSVCGVPELAAAVRELSRQKHVYAFSAGLCCSAAYWVASQCDAIYAAPSARVGSIGVLLPLLDLSGLYGKNGLRMDVISAGKYKAVGVPGTSLTEEHRLMLQAQVDSTWADFKAAVNSRRSVDETHMEGQTFTGTWGREVGLVDALANSIDIVQQKILRRHASQIVRS